MIEYLGYLGTVVMTFLYFIEKSKRMETESMLKYEINKNKMKELDREIYENDKSYNQHATEFDAIHIPASMLDGISSPGNDLSQWPLQGAAQASPKKQEATAIEEIGYGEKVIIEEMDDSSKVAYTERASKSEPAR